MARRDRLGVLSVSSTAMRLAVTLLSLTFTSTQSKHGGTDRNIQIMNESGHRVEIHWIHPNTGELVLQTTPHVFNGATFHLNSFVGHRFQVRELPGTKSGTCGDVDDVGGDKRCRTSYFTVNQEHDQVLFVQKGLEIHHQDDKTLAREAAVDATKECQLKAMESIGDSSSVSLDPEAVSSTYDDLVACVERNMAAKLEKASEEVSFQSRLREDMGRMIEEYTCADDELNTTESSEPTPPWRDARDRGKAHPVKVLFDRPASKIHVVDGFVSEKECQAIEEAAGPNFHRPSEGDDDYKKEIRAELAEVKIPWEKEGDGGGDPIAAVGRRIYDYAAHMTGLRLDEVGQEDMVAARYVGGRGDDGESDRRLPHCDGECRGMPHGTGGRVVTAVLHCRVPSRGGSVSFKNAAVHVRPEVGSATFVSYVGIGPDGETMVMDKGFTERSGCPVHEGEKLEVTQHIRLGVDGENPWHSWESMSGKKADVSSQ